MIRYMDTHLYEHAEKTGQEIVNIDHFEIPSNGNKNNKFKRTTLNVQEISEQLKLFYWQRPEV